MLFSSLLAYLKPRSPRSRKPQRPRAALGWPFRPRLEQLEDRTVPSNFTAASVSDLIADINAANLAGGSNTITLVSGTTFTLTAWDNYTHGPTGLPVIAANDNLTILGNSDTIARSTAAGTPEFRLLDLAAGASLTLKNLTLQGGLAFGYGVAAEGGAIYSQGTLDLNGATVQNNIAQGDGTYAPSGGTYTPSGGVLTAAGGGIYSSGSLTLEAGTRILTNQAVGGPGYFYWLSGDGGPPAVAAAGDGLGGGLYVAGGTLTVTNASVSSNTALGGQGVDWSSYSENRDLGQTFSLSPDNGGNGISKHSPHGRPGLGEGGGIYIYPGAWVSLDAFTLAHIQQNKASTSDPDIAGSYSTI